MKIRQPQAEKKSRGERGWLGVTITGNA